jgi:hypothetical protein
MNSLNNIIGLLRLGKKGDAKRTFHSNLVLDGTILRKS